MAPFSPLPTTSLKRPLTTPHSHQAPTSPSARSPLSRILFPQTRTSNTSPYDPQPESRTWLYGLTLTCLLVISILSLSSTQQIEGLTLRPTMGQIWDEHIHIGIGPPLIRGTTPVFEKEKNKVLEPRGRGRGLGQGGQGGRGRDGGRERGREKAGKEVERGVAKERLERMIALKQGELVVRVDMGTTPSATPSYAEPLPVETILLQSTSSAPPITPSSSQSSPTSIFTPTPKASQTAPKSTPTTTFSDVPQADQPSAGREGAARQSTDQQDDANTAQKRGDQGTRHDDRRSRIQFIA